LTNKRPNPGTLLNSVKHENQLNKGLLKMRPLPHRKIATSPFQAVQGGNLPKHPGLYTLCGHNVKLLGVKEVGSYCNHSSLKY